MKTPSRARRPVDGVLLLDKPSGLSSNTALQRARRAYEAEKAGHGGTLDPLASGLLPCLFGEATKFGIELLEATKTYQAEIMLGVVRTTGDAEGEVVERRPVAVDRAALEPVLGRFRGRIRQVPPMYSALKRHGRPLYAYARAGETLERTAREVTIHELTLTGLAADTLSVVVRCSKGTYIRSLAVDIGSALGCGASLAALRRTAIGRFAIGDALSLAALEELPRADRDAHLLPVDSLVEHLPSVTLAEGSAARFGHGQPVSPCTGGAGRVRVYDPAGGFIGIGTAGEAGTLRPLRLMRRAEHGPESRHGVRML